VGTDPDVADSPTVTIPTIDDEERRFILALREGDERAFAVLIGRYHTALVRLATTYVPSREVAEEVAQETW
jgi:RNA polymerase sigma-70 factor (ECF subfamily)